MLAGGRIIYVRLLCYTIIVATIVHVIITIYDSDDYNIVMLYTTLRIVLSQLLAVLYCHVDTCGRSLKLLTSSS